MSQTLESATAACPLCGDELDLGVPDWKVAPKWRAALAQRDLWAAVSIEFREEQSVEGAARRLGITPELTAYLLDFLCTDLCGCRAATCVSCFDDYRSEL